MSHARRLADQVRRLTRYAREARQDGLWYEAILIGIRLGMMRTELRNLRRKTP